MFGWLLTLTALAGADPGADTELTCDLMQWELATQSRAIEEVSLLPDPRARMRARNSELERLIADASCPEVSLPDACVRRGLIAARDHAGPPRIATPPPVRGVTFRSFDDRLAAEAKDHGVQWTPLAPPDPPLDTAQPFNSWMVIEGRVLTAVFGKSERLRGLREFQHLRCAPGCGARPGCEGHVELPALRGLYEALADAMDFNERWDFFELEGQLVDSGTSEALAARLVSELRVALFTSDAYPAHAWRRLTRVLERLDRPSAWSPEEQALAEAWLAFGAAWRDREHLRQTRGVDAAKKSLRAFLSSGSKEGSAEEDAVRAALAALVEGSVPAPPESCPKGSCRYEAPARALPAPPAPPWRSPPLPRPQLRHLQADACAPIREVRVGSVGRDSYGYARMPIVSPTVPGGALRMLMPVAGGEWRLVDVGPDGTVHTRSARCGSRSSTAPSSPGWGLPCPSAAPMTSTRRASGWRSGWTRQVGGWSLGWTPSSTSRPQGGGAGRSPTASRSPAVPSRARTTPPSCTCWTAARSRIRGLRRRNARSPPMRWRRSRSGEGDARAGSDLADDAAADRTRCRLGPIRGH